MNHTSSIALSGMNTAQTQMAAAAHNIANLATQGFKRQTVQVAVEPDIRDHAHDGDPGRHRRREWLVQLHPVVPPQELHLRHDPFLTIVKLPHSEHESPV